MIGEKLPARITGLRQAFRSNDPMGKGNVSRYYYNGKIKFQNFFSSVMSLHSATQY